MPKDKPVSKVVDLLDPSSNVIYGMSVDAARELVRRGDVSEIATIDGHFALVARDGITVRMCRTVGRIMRYFLAKRDDGPALIISDRIDRIHEWLQNEGLADQFHPSYTRMVPAHHLLEIRLVGCPDPNPTCRRFFTPNGEKLPTDVAAIGERYVGAVYEEIVKWLRAVPEDAPVGVSFSGGIDSGAVFLLTQHALQSLGLNPARLKAFTLAVDGAGDDARQAGKFLRALDMEFYLEPIAVNADAVDIDDAVRALEDYKPLDVQAAAVNLALLRGIRRRYPDWKYMLDGDGGDENLKDYPIEENPELTIRSVLNNQLLYQEGWGVDAVKHSLTYSGGLSRGYARSYAPAAQLGFSTLSPYTAMSVIRAAESIPFVELTNWQHDRLYRLKGEVVSHGVRAITGLDMLVFEKRRFQHGAMDQALFSRMFSTPGASYRRVFHELYA